MSIPARMIAIADIFEALTAGDRPYKKGMSLSRALKILGRMKLENHIDPDLFDVFIDKKIYLIYAKEHLNEDQIDEINFQDIPGYNPLN
jgi:HD-GYP domain-containing protein (c-di-GMP phosphodiesterase class II)